jgi:hypothetical protein
LPPKRFHGLESSEAEREIEKKNVSSIFNYGSRGGVVVKALRYKPAGRGFDSRLFHWNFSVT